ncbi:MAG TPA: N-acetyl-alpha-D-glucosaminyl L-malate synthase BshA [Longimicrobiales bacterium]|nr:N-acetyl-alpha-D-glucosaminyl L-malate synthase BshA [Longimicrobiales bacterium]
MRIGISCYPVYGGSGVVATELGMQLAQRGHEVHFITYAMPFRLAPFQENVFYHEVEVPSYPLFEHAPYNLALTVSMHNVAERYHLDLIHAHYAVPHATSAYMAKAMTGGKLCVVTTLHGTDITLVGQDPSYQSITAFSIKQSDGLTAVSEYLRRETVEHFDVAPERIEVIPNFVDLNEYKRDAHPCHRSRLSEKGEKIIMHISNFRPVKRVDDTVRVFALINRQLPSRLVLIGDGPERGRVQQVAEDEGVSDRVLFLGKQESVAEILACADLFLLPSATESFGLVALEAMSSGVPVVATRVGGLPEVVPEGEAGFLAEVGDVQTMAEQGVRILKDAGEWHRMSTNARAASEQYSTERVVPMYEKYYRQVSGRT